MRNWAWKRGCLAGRRVGHHDAPEGLPTSAADDADDNNVWVAAEWLLTCQRSDPKLNECLTKSFNHMIPALARGIPELGVGKFEPLHVDKIGLQKGNGGVIINGAFRNMEVHGPSNASATYVR